MNLSIIGGSSHMDRRLNLSNKTFTSLNTTLNPNAAEFVPSFHRSSSGSGSITGTGVGNPNAPEFIPSSLKSPNGNGNGNVRNLVTENLDRSESNASNNSEEEAHKYWRVQLPDDITPDFRATGEDELHATDTISLSRLSISDGILEPPVLSPSFGNNGNQSLWCKQFAEAGKSTMNGREFVDIGKSSMSGREFVDVGKSSMNGREVNPCNGASSASPVHDLIGGSIFSSTEDSSINPIKFLSLKYSGLSSQTLADIYLRSGQDMSLTLEILADMEVCFLTIEGF
jgi:Ataxin-2 C-terminal region